MSKSVFFANWFEQRETVETLTEESKADTDFYLFLAFSAFITTLGLHINNPIVIVGGMLVAPILFPILSLGMGVVTTSGDAIKRSIKNLGKSILGVVAISFVTSFLVNDQTVTEQMLLASNPDFIFFLVAFFSGIVASYSWVKQNVSHTLPGVAITVSLIPPLSAIGIGFSLLSRDVLSGSIVLFLLNLLGIVLASVLIFSLFGFSRLKEVQEEEIEEEVEEVQHERVQEEKKEITEELENALLE